ncbi:isoleucine--tRNA ligase [Flavimarina sp. Hel_I_48]|uniref:isoleucine--tRNA ligase n=1 Tax=Flavimarina sp. Hel_I_48 TaxID=1392488 RepID=UPI0004DEF015|nr:isoleucine--tRNA ligase [Flavimarina sp. Hel_I_48]
MSKKFAEYKGLDLPQIAEEIGAFWKENDIFEKSVTTRKGAEPFIFFEGPPSANGMPGIHHVMARAIKDIFCRFKTQKGFQVKRKAGWDTHGLPVELGVEKELGITKEDIGDKISVEEYNEACRNAVMRYTDVWNNLTEKMGYWVDMNDPYITYKPKYMETVWHLLKEIYDKDLIYKGYTIQPYSPKAGTGLSSHELNQPGTYQDVTDTTVTAQFRIPPTPQAGAQNSLAKAFRLDENSSPLGGGREGDCFFLAWTTTPWTLPSNTALTVGKNIDYVMVKTFNQYTFKPINVVIAKALVEKEFGKKYFTSTEDADFENFSEKSKKIPYQIIGECKGSDLLEIRYEPVLAYTKPHNNPENAYRVIAGDFVTTEDGTGIVHTSPTFGADDAMVAKQASPEIPPMLVMDENENLVPLVDLQGKFRKELKDDIFGLGGEYVKEEYLTDAEKETELKKQQERMKDIIPNLDEYLNVDKRIALKLKEENKAFKVEKYTHSYPNCWRTDKPILYYPLDSWFIKVTEVRDRMHELNATINWKPKSTGEGRFGNWLANANDWNLSRSRYWGIPLPIWRTEDGREELFIGSIEELQAEMKKAVAAGVMDQNIFSGFEPGDMSEANYDQIDLHKNVVDGITLVSPSGKPMKREADLIDVWFDSGSMPYAQWHYPFENKEKVDSTWRKADFIAEGVDQTRGWFYTLHAIATMIFDDVAYKNVVSNGLVLDKNGQKMSKRLGNAADPFTTLDTFGADATRWYMISNANPWDNLKFDLDGITEVQRKFFGTLYNTYSFFVLYANLDNFTYAEAEVELKDRPEIDRWILSELHTLIEQVDAFYADYEPTRATRAISDFVQENLSNWFVRLSRRRFWKGDYGPDKISAYQTLYTCLEIIAKLAAPVAPFFMDRLYKDLNAVTEKETAESVHLADFPVSDPVFIDPVLERKMQKAQTISSLVLSLRAKEKIKVRQPLQRIMIPILDKSQGEEILAVQELIKSEVNVKEVELIDDASGILVKTIKPNFKALGPRFGKDMKQIAAKINTLNAQDIAKIEKDGEMTLDINGKSITLAAQDVEITSQDIEGWLVASSGGITVALDVTLNESLENEGVARELVNRIQNLRKDSGFEVTDKIDITLQHNGKVEKAVAHNLEYIKNETLATSLDIVDQLNNGIDIEFDDVVTRLSIVKNN